MPDHVCKLCGESDQSKLQWRKNKAGVTVARDRCKACATRQHRAWVERTGDKFKEYRRDWWRTQREAILNMYGNECLCCAEKRIEFLGIEHENGDGHNHRRSLGGSSNFYKWLLKEKREGFCVLCHNCNLSRGFYGYCPCQKDAPTFKPLIVRKRFVLPTEKVDPYSLDGAVA